MTDRKIIEGAITAGIINATINGALQPYLLPGKVPIALTVNNITNDTTTVLGEAVPLAVTLAMIPTVFGNLTQKQPEQSFWPDVRWLMLKHGMFASGVVVSGAIIWQRHGQRQRVADRGGSCDEPDCRSGCHNSRLHDHSSKQAIVRAAFSCR